MTSTLSNFKVGLFFISTAVLFWGFLPIALKLASVFIDAVSLTWVRFLVALIFSLVTQHLFGQLSQFKNLRPKEWFLLSVAGLFLIINYVTFVWCLDYLGPGEAQLNFQTAPFYLAIGGLLFFKEKIYRLQVLFFSTLAFGLLMFFHKNLLSSQIDKNLLIGILLVQVSSMCWCFYALMQKWLHKVLSPSNILLFIFALGVVVMFPATELSDLPSLNSEQWLVVLFCSINTIVAYGCFAQSMKYWRTVEVSAMVAITPIVSFSASMLCATLGWWKGIIAFPSIDLLSGIGILVVVASAAMVQVVGKPQASDS